MTVSRAQAARFLLAKQGLLGPHRYEGKAGALAYVRSAGCIQFDPVDVCGRNAELTLASRVKGFTKDTLAQLLYADRALVDYPDKELSIFPAEDWPYFARYREQSRAHGKTFPGMEALCRQAEEYIAAHGPVSADTLPLEGKVFWHSSIHWSGHWDRQSPAARSALEQLYTDGMLVIHHKSGSRKFYGLARSHLPEALLSAPDPLPAPEDHIAWRVLRRIGAVGLLWDRRSDAFLGIPMDAGERSAAFARLLEAGRITPVEVEDIRGPLYLRAEDGPLLQAACAGQTDAKPRCELLAPLDPLLWDRRLIKAIFGFAYSWEIYTPPEKRRYGYYVLPAIYGEGFCGRVEAVADRPAQALRVKGFWPEPGVRRTKKLQAALAGALRRLAKLNGCSAIDFPEAAWHEEKS